MDSNEHLRSAVEAVQQATGCSDLQARAVVKGIACYISRFNEEIVNRYGPAHEFAEEQGI